MDSAARTKMQLDPRFQMAQAMMQEGSSTRPAQSGLEALARALQGVVGGYTAGKVGKFYQDKESAATQAMAQALRSDDPNAISSYMADSGDSDLMSAMLKQKYENMNTPPKTRSYMDGDKIVTEQWDPNTRTFTPLSRGEKFKPMAQGNGPVPGTSVQAWATNTLLTGDPNSQEYAMAYALATKPEYRQIRNPDGSQSLTEFIPNLPVRTPGAPSSTTPLPTPTGAGSPAPTATGAPSLPPPTPQAGGSPNLSTGRSTVNVVATGAAGGGQNTGARQDMAKFDASIDALMRYRQKLVDQGAGFRELAGLSSPLMTDYTDLFMGLKDINTLGALQAGDTEQLQKLVKDPSTFSGFLSGDEALIEQLDNATNMLRDRYDSYNKQFPGVKGKYTGAKYINGAWYAQQPDGKVVKIR